MKTKPRNAYLMPGLGFIAAVMVLAGCARLDPPDARSGPTTFRPTYSGDKVVQPVFTSPTVPSATNSLANTNSAPAGHN